ncbi:MAG TPA: class I SAM-dependent methyltransferase [Chitinophagaceae bacterium]|nr:class I SAM-dependent methyltransferase [Chitinophagaceae bacterium]
MFIKLNFLKTAYLLLLPAILLAGCASGQVKQRPKDSPVYSKKIAHPDGTGTVYMGREIAHMMGTAGGDWLERNTRQQEEAVTVALSKLPLQPTSVVADIGAGTGYYSFRLAPLVPKGQVYAVEVQDDFIKALEEKKNTLKLGNVTVVKGTDTMPNLPAASLDLAIMVDVYHELQYPHEMLQALYKALKPSGKLVLIEYRAEDSSIPIKALHKMSVAQANKELAANGFTLSRLETALPIQHLLIYEKAIR